MFKFSSFRRAFQKISHALKSITYHLRPTTSRTRSRRPLFISLAILALLVPTIFLYLQFARTTSAAWYNGSWLYRKELVFNNAASGTSLTDFPVMVKLTSANFNFGQAQSAGQDLRFTDSDGTTLLSYEIESFDPGSSTATIWVKVPQIDSASATDSIYVYWGNGAAADSQDTDNTWNANYKGVYHLNDNAANTTVSDSSGLTNNLTSSENTNTGFYKSTGNSAGSVLTSGVPHYITNQTAANNQELVPDIILDSSGFPVIAYYDATNTDLVLVHCNDSQCKGDDENVSIVDSTNNMGYYPTIQLDASGYPMIAYLDVTNSNLKFVHCNDANCLGGDETFSTLDSTGSVGYYPRMVKDSSGFPVIAYYDASSIDVNLVHCGNTDCSSGNVVSTVDATGSVGANIHGTDLVLDSLGYPVITYYDSTNTELKVAHCNDVNCAGSDESLTSPVSSLAQSTGHYTAIELDGSGLPMIAYHNATTLNMEYIHCDDANCAGDETASKIVIRSGDNSIYPSMEKDSSGIPVLVISRAQTYLSAIYCNSTSCNAPVYSDLATFNQFAAVAPNFKLDANNNIFAVAHSWGKTGFGDVYFVSTAHKLDRSYDSDLDFGTGSFSFSAWFKTNGLSQQQSLLSRYDVDQGYKLWLNFAGRACFGIDDDSTWGPDDSACSNNPQVSTNVDMSNGTTVSWQSMAVDSSGFPVIAYHDSSGLDLEIIHCNDANCAGANETFASLDSTGNVGASLSLALDSSGFPVISYYDTTNANLKLIHCGNANCSSGNVINIVDSTGDVGVYSTIKLDTSGYPVISYYDATNTAVKLAHCNDANCAGSDESIVTLIDTEDDRLRHGSESLQLDSSGYPMVVYSDFTNLDLEYIHCNDANCAGSNETYTNLDSSGSVGDFASMAQDASGYPVIAYYDTTNLKLKLIHCGNIDCSSGNSTNTVEMPNSGVGGYYAINIEMNNLGNPVIFATQYSSFSRYLTVCNDANCAGNNETNSLVRGNLYSYVFGAMQLDSSGFPIISYADTGDLVLSHLDNTTTFASTNSFDDSQWHQAVAVKNGTSSITMYVDGVAVATDSSILATATLTSNSASLNLSQFMTNGMGIENFGGQIDEVQIDTTARTADWVKAQYLSESNTFINQGSTEVRYISNLGIFTNNTGAIKNNLVAYYKFDEGFGTTTNNSGSGGSSLNGTFGTAAPSWSNTGKISKALSFNNTYLSLSSITTLGSTFTFSSWINPSSLPNTYHAIYGASQGINSIICSAQSTGEIIFRTSSAGAFSELITSGANIQLNQWQHIACIYDGANRYIYVNGKLKGQDTTANWSNSISANGSIGRRYTSDLPFYGMIDEVKIYNAALTADEVKQDYNKKSTISFGSLSDTSSLTGGSVASNSASAQYCVPGSSDPCTPPLAEWKFEESSWTNNCSTATAMDSSGNGNNLTSCPSSTGQTTGSISNYGKSPQLDGVDDYFESTSTQLNLSGAITMEAWVKPTATPLNDDYFINRTNANAGYAFGWASAMNPKIRIGNGTTYSDVTGSTVLSVGTWYHLEATIDGSGNAIIYVNGKVDTTSTTGVLSTATQNFRIGTRSAGNEIAAAVDEVKIFNYVRTPSQVAWDYNQGKPIAHWKMEELVTPSYDSSGNNYHLTWSGNVAQTTGKFNSGTAYDGVDDYLSCTDAACGGIGKLDFGAGASFSYGTWFKTSTIAPDVLLNKKFAPASALSPGYVSYIDASGNVYCAVADGVIQKNLISTGTNYSDNAWHQVICTVNSTTVSQYIDGRLTVSAANTVTGSYDTTEDFKTAINGGNNNDYVGSLDDTRIYNYVLTPTQIKTLYNESSAIRFGP